MIHILVVDDDKDLNRLVCSYLNDSGFETKGCLSVSEAYDEMYANLYDLIISDIGMLRNCSSQIKLCIMEYAIINSRPNLTNDMQSTPSGKSKDVLLFCKNDIMTDRLP